MDKIDFVITWVDGSDPEWRKEKSKYSNVPESDAGEYRYRDMGILKYWFRAVEKYAPWVNKVYFITYGHLPQWLNTACPKLKIVNHSDYIPEKYLPTFSANPIELNIHRIDGLSEYFVYFNDDTFLNNEVRPEFFYKKGKPCDFAHVVNLGYADSRNIYAHMLMNSVNSINKNYGYIRSFFKNPAKYINRKYPLKNNLINLLKLENKNFFSGFENHHLPFIFLKSTLEAVWEENNELLDYVSSNKFRTACDVTAQIFRYHQLVTGKFAPVSKDKLGKNFNIYLDEEELLEAIRTGKHKMLCLNDSEIVENFDQIKEQLINAYEMKLPEKSMFEI